MPAALEDPGGKHPAQTCSLKLHTTGRSYTVPAVAQERQWPRLFWSAFLHADEMHLFYNMSSLLWKVDDASSL
jgi:membrane associated rhomboid family serine protease